MISLALDCSSQPLAKFVKVQMGFTLDYPNREISSFENRRTDMLNGTRPWQRRKTDPSCVLQVTKLFEGNQYEFRVAAENKIGVSDFTQTSEPVTAKMPFGQ